MSSKEEYGRGKMVDNGGIWDEQSFRDFEINRDKNVINQLETELADARAEIERLKLISQNQETVIAAQRRSAKAKNELIERMREALSLVMEGAIHDFHYACQHRNSCLCWGCQKKRVNAALAAERGE